MRIAIFSEVYWPMVSGVGVTLDRLTRGLQSRGHVVRVYSATFPLPPGVPDRPEVHRSPGIPLFLYPDLQWAFPRQREVVADLALFRPDVVHVATEFAIGLAGLKAAKQLGLPIIASAHTDYQKYAHRYGVGFILRLGWIYLRWFYAHAERVLVPSRVYERYLNSRGVVHTALWSRGVDPVEFQPGYRSERYRARCGVGPDDLLVTYIGRLAREKDLERLVDAWVALEGRRGAAQLVLVGQGPLEADIRARGIPGIHVPGLLSGRELGEAYASADLFVFPSPTETFGNSLLEAMASGLPALAVRAGGVLDYARHDVNAWLAPAHDTGELTSALARLMADKGLRERLAQGGLAEAGARTWGRIYDGLIEEYRRAVEAGRSSRAA